MNKTLDEQGFRDPSKPLPPKGARIHLLGICGTGMAGLAGILKQMGFNVTGSDENLYPPMSDMLHRLGIPVTEGYSPDHLEPEPILVVVGNVIRKDNPEVRAVIDREIPYMSLPQAISHFCLETRVPLVVAGTHGKTTTSSMLVSVLKEDSWNPGFLIGGILHLNNAGFDFGEPPWFVVEGDEYDSSFFDKRPKFMHYIPDALLLTSLEFDHADIYKDIDEIYDAFRKLVRKLPSVGVLVACSDWPKILDLIEEAPCLVMTYGTRPDAAWRLEDLAITDKGTSFSVYYLNKFWGRVSIPLTGEHNALNALGVIAVSHWLGAMPEAVRQGLAKCKGVKRRQELLGDIGGVKVIDDFAHHPTAVRETLKALRSAYRPKRLIAVFEPRTNTSRRSCFQDDYAKSLSEADIIYVREVPNPEKAPSNDRFSSFRLVDALEARGRYAYLLSDGREICSRLLEDCLPGDMVVILSNGPFEGLGKCLVSGLEDKINKENIG